MPFPKKSLIGRNFGRLTVTAEAEPARSPAGKSIPRLVCACTCGRQDYVIQRSHWRRWPSCGCVTRLRQEHQTKPAKAAPVVKAQARPDDLTDSDRQQIRREDEAWLRHLQRHGITPLDDREEEKAALAVVKTRMGGRFDVALNGDPFSKLKCEEPGCQWCADRGNKRTVERRYAAWVEELERVGRHDFTEGGTVELCPDTACSARRAQHAVWREQNGFAPIREES